MVILATNLQGNLDDVFVRRMHFSLESPFLSFKERRRIWDKILPQDTPVSRDLNLDMMAQRFEIAGGNIRNIALAAAFLAANDGGAIAITHLLWATRREYQKMGRVVANGEFNVAKSKITVWKNFSIYQRERLMSAMENALALIIGIANYQKIRRY